MDDAAASCHHAFCCGTGGVKYAFHVQIHDFVKGFLGVFHKWRAFRYTGVVHQNIHAAVFTGGFPESLSYRFQTGEIGADAGNGGLRIFFLQPGNRLIGRSLRACGQNDGCAFLQKFIGGRKTDAAASAGNDGNFIFESHVENLPDVLYGCSITEREAEFRDFITKPPAQPDDREACGQGLFCRLFFCLQTTTGRGNTAHDGKTVRISP